CPQARGLGVVNLPGQDDLAGGLSVRRRTRPFLETAIHDSPAETEDVGPRSPTEPAAETRGEVHEPDMAGWIPLVGRVLFRALAVVDGCDHACGSSEGGTGSDGKGAPGT